MRGEVGVKSEDMMEACLSSQETDVEKLEKKINCGQIEEVIFQVGPVSMLCRCFNEAVELSGFQVLKNLPVFTLYRAQQCMLMNAPPH